jgi:hypothetical protein
MGWLPRRDVKKSKFQLEWKPRPARSVIRQWFLRSNMDYIMTMAGTMETRNQDLTLEPLFQSGDRFAVRYSHLFDRTRRPFNIQDVAVLPGSYTWDSAQVRFLPSPNRALSGEVSIRQQWGFYGGSNTELAWRPLWKPSPNVSVGPAYQWSRVSLPRGRFTSHLINSQLNYAFSNRWLTATTIQYNNLARLTSVNFRLNYIYRPGDDMFLVYNEATTRADGTNAGSKNRSIILKVTRSWDF